jgi:hypothetical protein
LDFIPSANPKLTARGAQRHTNGEQAEPPLFGSEPG